MKIVIIEDEKLAAEKIVRLLKKYDPGIKITDCCSSVKKAVEWFQQNPSPDLVFMDIQLGDGLSFEIFEQVKITCPVIFTTAYDEYALRAFQVNSLDYLLKPISLRALTSALDKYKSSPWSQESSPRQSSITYEKVLQQLTNQYKKRFLVKVGTHLKTIQTESIAYFYSLEKATYFTETNGKNHLIDYTLEQLTELLDPELFFRINRKYIISVGAIEDMNTLSNYRLKLKLLHCTDNEIFVSREKLQDFKGWLDK